MTARPRLHSERARHPGRRAPSSYSFRLGLADPHWHQEAVRWLKATDCGLQLIALPDGLIAGQQAHFATAHWNASGMLIQKRWFLQPNETPEHLLGRALDRIIEQLGGHSTSVPLAPQRRAA
jgi:hypothetical protein